MWSLIALGQYEYFNLGYGYADGFSCDSANPFVRAEWGFHNYWSRAQTSTSTNNPFICELPGGHNLAGQIRFAINKGLVK